ANSARITRFKEKLALYDFEVTHVKGVENVVADWLSRHVNVIEGQDEQQQPWQVLDEIINNKNRQILFEWDNNDGIRTESRRNGPLRIITVWVGPNT
ncbi:hypothetical protein, partial [Klebsiella pneumoniae]|uniref:hypothetical protein n=1 Tax=Klebsiella pneumoniae TaxID=573 RepID=UPI00405548A6